MSQCDIIYNWRCPNCKTVNQVNMTWQICYIFNEILEPYPYNIYVKEKCKHCNKEYYINEHPPGYWAFPKFNPDKDCVNDFVKDLVLDTGLPLTINRTFVTT